ncbi:MAG: hypothetical protein IPM55_19800 [Acidobacteria bacterium]|nr:hypothetical protein [Acidobacteriota bacterium]
MLLLVVVHSAGIQDREGAQKVLDGLRHFYARLCKIWADGAYNGNLAE